MNKRILVLIIFLVVVAGYFLWFSDYFTSKPNYSADLPELPELYELVETGQIGEGDYLNRENKIGCTRTERHKNNPEYDRALSLINQRIATRNSYIKPENEHYDYLHFSDFSPEITNCIKVVPTTMEDEEGYFEFDTSKVLLNFYIINVSDNYSYTDDLTTALLLSHELTHVQQFIDYWNNDVELDCIDSEVQAFISQLNFYVLLNSEEVESIWQRINAGNKTENIQFEILNAMMSINQQSDCNIMDYNCTEANLKKKLKEFLLNDDYYRKQCNL